MSNQNIDTAVGLSRKTLNVRAFIGLFIFGWLMKMNYDDLGERGLGWTFLIVMLVLFVAAQAGSPAASFALLLVYVGAWVHTNSLLTARRAHIRQGPNAQAPVSE